MRYRRADVAGGTYFFTVNLADRKADLLTRHIDVLREVMQQVKQAHPFVIEAMVVLPEHLHTIWRLPHDDVDFPMRWSLIKAGFSRRLPKTETIRASRQAKRERGIWQRRYWEHCLRNEIDFERHVDYIHYNPVKHGYVRRVIDWPFSTFHKFVERGVLSADWGDSMVNIEAGGECLLVW
ncbi:MAG: transposase [Methylophilaceae bacterium]|nr:transposase [Methylophilaceae bacterium]